MVYKVFLLFKTLLVYIFYCKFFIVKCLIFWFKFFKFCEFDIFFVCFKKRMSQKPQFTILLNKKQLNNLTILLIIFMKMTSILLNDIKYFLNNINTFD